MVRKDSKIIAEMNDKDIGVELSGKGIDLIILTCSIIESIADYCDESPQAILDFVKFFMLRKQKIDNAFINLTKEQKDLLLALTKLDEKKLEEILKEFLRI